MPEAVDADASVTRRDGHYAINYELTSRIYASAVYPIRSSNGSDILIYGSTSGITVLWRGGRRPRESAIRSREYKPAESVVVIDLDDDESVNKRAQSNQLDFEELPEEHDDSRPFDDVVYQTEYDLGSAAVGIALPSIANDGARRLGSAVPPILKTQMVLLVSCADSSIRLVTVALSPQPRHSPHGKGQVTQQVLLNSNTRPDDSVATTLSLTWTTSDVRILHTDEQHEHAMEDDSETPSDWEWDIIAAACSSDSQNRLTVYSIPILRSHGSWIVQGESKRLLHDINLSSSVASLGFSTSSLSSASHTQLLIAHKNGTLRIFDPTPRPAFDAKGEKALAPKHWLTTFKTPFEIGARGASIPGHTNSKHKRILDAKWGRAGMTIVALLEGAEWGLWELLASTDNSEIGIRGSSLTSFSLRGVLGEPDTLSTYESENVQANGLGAASGNLVPMTPNTRKAKSKNFFKNNTGSMGHKSPANCSGVVPYGRISLLPSSFNRADSSALFWYKQSIYYLPSLASYWQRARQTTVHKGSVGTLYGPNTPELPALSTGGERLTSVSLLHGYAAPTSSSSKVLQQDVVVSAEHRIIILSPGKPDPISLLPSRHGVDDAHTAVSNLFLQEEGKEDQTLLSRGDLDLGGLDRLLDGMSRPHQSLASVEMHDEPVRERRVGFAADY